MIFSLGEIAVDQQQFPLLLEAAKSLKIKGLYEESDDASLEEEKQKENLDTISVTSNAEYKVSHDVKSESLSPPGPRKRSPSEESEEEPIRSPPSLHTDPEAEEKQQPPPSKMFKYSPGPMQGVSNPFWMISQQQDKKTETPQDPEADVPNLLNIVNQANLDSKSLPSAQKLNEQFLQAMQMCTNPYLAAMQKPLDLLSPNFNSNSSFTPTSPNTKGSSPGKSMISSAPVRRYKQYSEDSLQAALKEIMGGQSINRSSMKHNIPARTLRDWMKRLNIKSVFTHHSHNKERSNSHDGSTDRESSSSISPEPVTSPGFSGSALFTSPGGPQNDSVFPGMKINVKEDEIDDDEPRTLRIDESPLNNITQIAQEAN